MLLAINDRWECPVVLTPRYRAANIILGVKDRGVRHAERPLDLAEGLRRTQYL
jgi:hypothetical protein